MKGADFHPEARAEFLAAVAYYEDQVRGLGDQLTDEIEHAVQLIVDQPGLGVALSEPSDFRRLPLRRFPYHLIYRSAPGTVLILAVAHQRRRPGYWKKRG